MISSRCRAAEGPGLGERPGSSQHIWLSVNRTDPEAAKCLAGTALGQVSWRRAARLDQSLSPNVADWATFSLHLDGTRHECKSKAQQMAVPGACQRCCELRSLPANACLVFKASACVRSPKASACVSPMSATPATHPSPQVILAF